MMSYFVIASIFSIAQMVVFSLYSIVRHCLSLALGAFRLYQLRMISMLFNAEWGEMRAASSDREESFACVDEELDQVVSAANE